MGVAILPLWLQVISRDYRENRISIDIDYLLVLHIVVYVALSFEWEVFLELHLILDCYLKLFLAYIFIAPKNSWPF